MLGLGLGGYFVYHNLSIDDDDNDNDMIDVDDICLKRIGIYIENIHFKHLFEHYII